MPDAINRALPCREQAELISALNALKSINAAPELAQRIRSFLIRIAAARLSGHAMTRLISAFNDQLTARVVEIVAAGHRLPPVA